MCIIYQKYYHPIRPCSISITLRDDVIAPEVLLQHVSAWTCLVPSFSSQLSAISCHTLPQKRPATLHRCKCLPQHECACYFLWQNPINMHQHSASCARIVRHVTLGRSYLCKPAHNDVQMHLWSGWSAPSAHLV